MHKVTIFLREHPGWGMFSSVGGALQTLMDTSTPVLQYLALIIGIGIGIITLITKIKELRRNSTRNS